jgi:DNA-binding SARP family transcriptional activator/tetratricopeptide (TPR) repeat protein
MAKLELNYLGDFAVLRNGRPGKLPPSKKTRALLAYLSLNPRRFRRDFLCELLWEIPDDPRGSLRWSLSKLRRLIDDEDHQRIVADRTYVEIDTTGVDIDAEALQALVGGGFNDTSTETLEDAAARYRGNFLEGLDLPNFHDFHAWCVAEREQVSRAQASLLKELVVRLGDEPERVLPHARSLVAISPYDEELRAGLIRTLVSLDRHDEAEQHFQLGLRMLKEVGAVSTGTLAAARKRALVAEPAPSAPAPRSPRPSIELSSHLVGRDREASLLAELFEQVRRDGEARFALVRGEPGIGKTRLVEAVSALAEGSGATVLHASAYESESIRPFALWIDALHRFDESAMKETFTAEEGGNRDRLFDRLSEFIAEAATEKPVVLVFDDVHWCDDSSAAAIHYVARMNRERPVFGILASRVADISDNVGAQQAIAGLRHDGLLTDVPIGPLREHDLVQLIRERAPDADAEKLGNRCGGNPLLAIELARAEVQGAEGTSLTDLVSERMARASIDGAEVLRWAAVLNPHIDIGRIATLAGIEQEKVTEILESAIRQGMLTTPGGSVNFTHELLARAVYQTLSPMRRQVMHRRAAELLEDSVGLDLTRAADLAHHATQSGDPGLAARALVSAARMSLRFYDNDKALIHARRGMQLAEQLPDAERVCVLIELSDVRFAAGPLDDWEQSATEFAALAEQALDHGELNHARLGYHLAATVRWAHGQWTHAREQSLQSERVVRMGKDEDHVIGLAETAKCLVMIERDLSKADAMLMEAQAMSERKGFNHYAIPAAQGMLRFHEDRMDEATELFREALTLCKSAGSRIDEFQANEYLAMIEFQRGRYEEAKVISANLVAIGDKLRIGSEGPYARAMSALCDFAMTDDAGGLDDALAALREVDAKHRLAYTLTRAAQIDCDRDRLDIAKKRATEALEYATVLQRATEMSLAHAVLGCAAVAANDEEAAASHQSAIEELETKGVATWARAFYRQKPAAKE